MRGATGRPARRGLGAAALLSAAAALLAPGAAADAPWAKPDDAVRFAVFNVSLARQRPSVLIDQLRAGPENPRAAAQIDAIVEIIQRVRPDVLLLLELDYDPAGEALGLFEAALAAPRNGAAPLRFAHRFAAPVNTGVAVGADLDRDGVIGGPTDAQGWGLFRGQFGMALLSRHPIETESVRTFQTLLWADAPWAEAPVAPDGAPFYAPEVWRQLRLSSKSHWDAPIRLPDGRRVHVLASHPTPPVFDGPEDRNGLRNAAEIRFWADYVSGADWPVDDVGRAGGLDQAAAFVLLGDLNADPVDGDARRGAIEALLTHPRVQPIAPESAGGRAAAAAQGGANRAHRAPPAQDTADWKDTGVRAPGNLRVDYALPSQGLRVLGSGVFWPGPEDPLRRLVGDGFPPVSSDHRLVWIDVALEN